MIDTIIQGDSKEVLKGIASDSVDLIVTDPPYGYSFMGKDWDKAVIGIDIWSECLRVLKAGAFAFIMSAPRQDVLSRMIVNLQDAGFVVGFSSIYWCFASGFPKAGNIRKLVDKRLGAEREVVGKHITGKAHLRAEKRNLDMGFENGQMEINETIPSTPEAKALDGSYGGFQPKPALEVILVVMKPCSEKTYVDQALANGHGVTWLDNGRIPVDNNNDSIQCQSYSKGGNFTSEGNYKGHREYRYDGRFPANLLVSDDVLNDGVDRKSGWTDNDNKGIKQIFGSEFREFLGNHINDTGSFSRFFSLDSWWDNRIKQLPESIQKTFPFIIVPKASKSEKNKGCDGLEGKDGGHFAQDEWSRNNMGNTPDSQREKVANHHPCCKPVKLFSYLITLGSREGDLILDPFVGSGTSAVACKALNRHWIGIERESDYVGIAEARIAHEQRQPELALAGG